MHESLALAKRSSQQAVRARSQEEGKMAEYKGAAKEGARAMALMKKREKMKADIEAAKNKISEVRFLSREFGFFFVNFRSMTMK